jgi:hypothetical protein
VDVAAGRARARSIGLVELLDQAAGQGQLGGVGRTHDQRIGAGFGQHRGFEAAVGQAGGGRRGARNAGGRTRVNQALHHGGHVGCDAVAQTDHFHACGVGHVQRGNDAAQALQVVAVVGDHQSVGAGVHVDGVVGADQRAQHRHQVVGVFVVQSKDLRDHLTAAADHGAGRDRATLQFGFGFGQDRVQTGRLDQGKALRTQLGGKQMQGLRRGHGHLAGQRHRALDAGIDHHVVPRQAGQCAGHGFDVGIHKVQGDRLFAFGAGFAGCVLSVDQ